VKAMSSSPTTQKEKEKKEKNDQNNHYMTKQNSYYYDFPVVLLFGTLFLKVPEESFLITVLAMRWQQSQKYFLYEKLSIL
jgi:hypothetical protein